MFKKLPLAHDQDWGDIPRANSATPDEIDRVLESLHEYERVKRELEELRSGKTVVLPRNEDHARFMVMVAQGYLNRCHEETFNALAKVHHEN